MRSEPVPNRHPGGQKLEAGAAIPAGFEPLMHFEFTGPSPDAEHPGLKFLGGSLLREFWWTDAEVVVGQDHGLAWRQAGDLLFMACEVPDDGQVDSVHLARESYARLLKLAAERGCPHLLRAWNFMPAINAGRGDQERYRRFCIGRSQALTAAGVDDPELPAGTAIGGDDPRLRIFMLTSTVPGINIENPRQVSAYRYPRQYGPRSPSFARATALPQAGGEVLLMVSGTASVVGHETVHDGDLDAQMDEIAGNLEVLLSESAQRLHRPDLATFGRQTLLRTYVRHAEHWPRVEQKLSELWPDCPVVGLRGDICRDDLLVEIEAVTRG